MKKVNVAELKAHLSACLREARAGGGIIVFDRSVPIARIVPYAPRDRGIVLTPPRKPLSRFKRVRGVRPRDRRDPVEILLEDRERG